MYVYIAFECRSRMLREFAWRFARERDAIETAKRTMRLGRGLDHTIGFRFAFSLNSTVAGSSSHARQVTSQHIESLLPSVQCSHCITPVLRSASWSPKWSPNTPNTAHRFHCIVVPRLCYTAPYTRLHSPLRHRIRRFCSRHHQSPTDLGYPELTPWICALHPGYIYLTKMKI